LQSQHRCHSKLSYILRLACKSSRGTARFSRATGRNSIAPRACCAAAQRGRLRIVGDALRERAAHQSLDCEACRVTLFVPIRGLRSSMRDNQSDRENKGISHWP